MVKKEERKDVKAAKGAGKPVEVEDVARNEPKFEKGKATRNYVNYGKNVEKAKKEVLLDDDEESESVICFF